MNTVCVSEARTMTLAQGGRWHGGYGTAPCPICQPEGRPDQVALTISNGAKGILLHCKKAGCNFRDILLALGISYGTYTPLDQATIARRDADRHEHAKRRSAQAQALWREAVHIKGTIAAAYLRERRVTCPLPDTLRYHPMCWHGPTARHYPAMVALVQGGGDFAVHRTYLRADGLGKAGLEGGDKLMLGAVAGGAVRLTEGPSRLVVAEGIESGLSLLCGLLDSPATVWAALSTSGLRGLQLPAQPGRLTVGCDGDEPGRAAANALAERAHGLGWAVGILDPRTGADWNDILTGKAMTA